MFFFFSFKNSFAIYTVKSPLIVKSNYLEIWNVYTNDAEHVHVFIFQCEWYFHIEKMQIKFDAFVQVKMLPKARLHHYTDSYAFLHANIFLTISSHSIVFTFGKKRLLLFNSMNALSKWWFLPVCCILPKRTALTWNERKKIYINKSHSI